FAEPTSRGFPMMELPVPVLHRTALRPAAKRLGIDADELYERWPATFAEQLGDLTVRAIPRIRADAMPTRYFLPRDRYAGITVVEDPLAETYRELDALVEQYRSLVELEAPAEELADVARSIQDAYFGLEASASVGEPKDAWNSDLIWHRVPEI